MLFLLLDSIHYQNTYDTFLDISLLYTSYTVFLCDFFLSLYRSDIQEFLESLVEVHNLELVRLLGDL